MKPDKDTTALAYDPPNTGPAKGPKVSQVTGRTAPGGDGGWLGKVSSMLSRYVHGTVSLADTQPTVTAHTLKSRGPGVMISERYRVQRLIGRGGMGSVYEVVHNTLGKSFALKLMSDTINASAETQRLFFREARYASRLQHSSLPDVVDFGQDSNFGWFMVVEYLEGESLNAMVLRKTRLSLRHASNIVLQVAEGLKAMHDSGLVHCDIKAENVMITMEIVGSRQRERVKLIDFGLARSKALAPQKLVYGTPHYLALEMIGGAQPSPSTDIYALGVVFYYLLSGELPFEGTMSEILAGHHGTAPPSLSDFPDMNEAIASLVAKALSKAPETRYACFRTCDDLTPNAFGFFLSERSGITLLTPELNPTRGTFAYRVVDGVLEAIHDTGVDRCLLSSDLAVAGTRLDGLPYDFGATSPGLFNSTSLLTNDGIWSDPTRFLGYDGIVTSVDWTGFLLNDAMPRANREGFVVAATEEASGDVVAFTTDTAGARTEIGRVLAASSPSVTLVTKQAAHVSSGGACTLIKSDGSGAVEVAGPCSGTLTDDGTGYVIEKGWYPLGGGAGVIHDNLSPDIESLPTPFGVAVHITRNRGADFALTNDFTVWAAPNDALLDSTTPPAGLVIETNCTELDDAGRLKCFREPPECVWFDSGICACSVERAANLGTFGAAPIERIHAIFECTDPAEGVVLEKHGTGTDANDNVPFHFGRQMPQAGFFEHALSPRAPLLVRAHQGSPVGFVKGDPDQQGHQTLHTVLSDLSTYQLTDRRIWAHGWRGEISYDRTISVAGDGTVYRVDVP